MFGCSPAAGSAVESGLAKISCCGYVLLYPILIPLLLGTLCLFIPKRMRYASELLSICTSLATLIITICLFTIRPWAFIWRAYPLLNLDNLSSFIMVAIAAFGFLVTLYSVGFMKGRLHLNQYYTYLLWTIGASVGAVLANNLILFLAFWGFLAITLYLMINLQEGEGVSEVAKKALIIIGGSDAVIIFGIALIWRIAHSFDMNAINIVINSKLSAAAYLSLAIGAFAKAGAMPLHTWVPDTSEKAPLPVAAFLPASLDKLLGIYFLVRISTDIFKLNVAMQTFLMALGSFTIIAAVMMALVQHNYKRLLGYHAVSQVGYMILGIGTGTAIGIAGGLFHMLNNAIYKCCLFFAGGAVEKERHTTELDQLGGLARFMPITFVTCLVSALAISGVPPLNGFASKWMIYQGVIELGKGGGRLWVIWLVAAMFGSALTLASFMKLIHATFLGQPSSDKRVSEVGPAMWVPMVILAAASLLFGIFVYKLPLKFLINPAVEGVRLSGLWSAGTATILIIVGIAIGFIIYLLGNLKGLRRDPHAYTGGEILPDEARVTGVEFYKNVKEMQPFATLYKLAEKKVFDIYDILKGILSYFTGLFRALHTGILLTYITWVLFGILVLLWIFMR
ncbi:MAG: hypothetical protein HQ593_01050 [Candidatus Omnitrophica bacterium]|nr:hypothetical protein [Candidatus Omnitrophota bacterium]